MQSSTLNEQTKALVIAEKKSCMEKIANLVVYALDFVLEAMKSINPISFVDNSRIIAVCIA